MRAACLLGTLVALAAAFTAAAEGRVHEDAEWDPNLMDERGLDDVEDDDIDIGQADESIPEAQNYYELTVEEHRKGRNKKRRQTVIYIGVGISVGKRSVDAQLIGSKRTSVENILGYIIGNAAEAKPYRSRAAILQLGASTVIQADLYERRLAPRLPRNIQEALGGKQSGVVITLKDGRKFLVVKGNQYGKGRAPGLIPANRMAPDWKKITSKAISNSVVGDFISAAKRGYDVVKNNGNQAAARMMLMT